MITVIIIFVLHSEPNNLINRLTPLDVD